MQTHPAPPAHAGPQPTRAQLTAMSLLVTLLIALVLVVAVTGSLRAYAAGGAAVGLGTADPYSVLAGSAVTNTGNSVLDGDLGVSPDEAISGFPPGLVGGDTNAGNAEAAQAQSDLTIAYNDAAGRASNGVLNAGFGGETLTGGVYTASRAALLTGTITLDGEDDPNSVFIFQIGSALTTATNSTVALINGAQACNVYWQVGSSATLRTNTTFVGTVMALTSISLQDSTTVDGRALARNGAVTLINNVFTSSPCDRSAPSASPSDSATATDSPSPGESDSPSSSASGSTSPSVIVTSSSNETDSPTVEATSTAISTATDLETDSNGAGSSSSSGSGLAATGGSSLTTALGVGGLLLVLAAAIILGSNRFRSRPRGRH